MITYYFSTKTVIQLVRSIILTASFLHLDILNDAESMPTISVVKTIRRYASQMQLMRL